MCDCAINGSNLATGQYTFPSRNKLLKIGDHFLSR